MYVGLAIGPLVILKCKVKREENYLIKRFVYKPVSFGSGSFGGSAAAGKIIALFVKSSNVRPVTEALKRGFLLVVAIRDVSRFCCSDITGPTTLT